MKRLKDIDEAKKVFRVLKVKGETIGLVPTMGYLHEGHLSLVRAAVKNHGKSVVSIFVNPAQFAPAEDFEEYPRDLEGDLALLESEGVDFAFIPESGQMYPEGYCTYVEVHGLQDKLCGRSRPVFFKGVCTVVLKLFNIVQPDVAYFGKKDVQQAIILRRMIRDLDLDVKLEVMPMIRDEDGLALSSRNAYFSPEEKTAALVLPRSLDKAREMVRGGERDAGVIRSAMEALIQREPRARIDYIELVDPIQLDPVQELSGDVLIALAVFIGKIRLIDNTLLEIEEASA